MTRSRAKKAKKNLDKEVNYFFSLKPILEEETLKMVQMNQVDKGPNVGHDFFLVILFNYVFEPFNLFSFVFYFLFGIFCNKGLLFGLN